MVTSFNTIYYIFRWVFTLNSFIQWNLDWIYKTLNIIYEKCIIHGRAQPTNFKKYFNLFFSSYSVIVMWTSKRNFIHTQKCVFLCVHIGHIKLDQITKLCRNMATMDFVIRSINQPENKSRISLIWKHSWFLFVFWKNYFFIKMVQKKVYKIVDSMGFSGCYFYYIHME